MNGTENGAEQAQKLPKRDCGSGPMRGQRAANFHFMYRIDVQGPINTYCEVNVI